MYSEGLLSRTIEAPVTQCNVTQMPHSSHYNVASVETACLCVYSLLFYGTFKVAHCGGVVQLCNTLKHGSLGAQSKNAVGPLTLLLIKHILFWNDRHMNTISIKTIIKLYFDTRHLKQGVLFARLVILSCTERWQITFCPLC